MSPKTSFISLDSGSSSAFASSNFFFVSSSSSRSKPSFVVDSSLWPANFFSHRTEYSSSESVMCSTSRPFLRSVAKEGDEGTAAMLSRVLQEMSFWPSFLHSTYSFKLS